MLGQGAAQAQVEVVDLAWDEGVGVRELEAALLRHFLSEAWPVPADGGDPGPAPPRAVAKLRAQVKRALRVLSANADTRLSVEELHDGHDFRSSITRDAFEALAGALGRRSGLAVLH